MLIYQNEYGGRTMKSLKWITGIGLVDDCGEVYDRYPYDGAKGFKIIQLGQNKYVYSLETQKKLFYFYKKTTLVSNKKAIVVPLLPIKYIPAVQKLNLRYIDKTFGVFDTRGELIGWGKKIKLEDRYFLKSDSSSEGEWGLYTYKGEQILPESYNSIEPIELTIDGRKKTVFCLEASETGTKSLLDPAKRILISWASGNIKVNKGTNRVIRYKDEKKTVYQLKLDDMGRLTVRKES